jgi:hypothetical protein
VEEAALNEMSKQAADDAAFDFALKGRGFSR